MAGRELELGAFSVGLAVKDLAASKAFYEALGFSQTGGDGDHYLIMVNGAAIVGLFHGMFEGNILTFNPGLGQNKELLSEFTDVRDIRARLVEAGIEMITDTDPEGTGPAHVAFVDPDGNAVLIDQFFPRPGSEEA
jgi:catechol 2,3-dioxygenase-like lactoylglutathione lyase family enzyme